MLPRNKSTHSTRRAWIIFLLLSPLAYAAGIILVIKADPNAQAGLSLDRGQSIAAAARFAASRGIDVAGWDSFYITATNNDRLFYYRLRPGAERDRVRRLAPEIEMKVLLRSPDRAENIEIKLGPDGRPLGFTRNLAANKEATDPGEAAARRMAEAAFRARPEVAELGQPPEPALKETSDSGFITRSYTWRWPLASMPELELESVVSVRGGTVVSETTEARVDRAFVKSQFRRDRVIKVISQIVYSLAMLVVVIFGIYRFVQRAQQKEVSYPRVFLLSVIFAAVMVSVIVITDVATYQVAAIPGNNTSEWVIIFTSGITYLIVGLFLGLAYGSGEGDIREAYPGKLTSLDALIIGKVFSRNVARAVVIGWAFGGWVLLTKNLIALLWQRQPGAGGELGPLEFLISRHPWLSALTHWPMDVILVLVIGLLLPLPFLRRRLRSQQMIIAFLAVFLWVACAAPYLPFRPWTVVLVMAAMRTGFLLLAFFGFDLLTAAISISAPAFVTSVVTLAAQPAPSLQRSGMIAALIALALLAVEFIYAFKGRRYSEDEVRPMYAGLLAERLSLQAEVSAAREAQVRLLPQRLPMTSHFTVAASCLPAHEVGGDFYDFFELDSGKLGVLIAEGGGRGLGSALSIAFAKGFVMPKIMGDTRADDSPAEVIRSLQDRLTRMLDQDAAMGIAYAVIDTADGTLRYARTGAFPRLLVGRGGGRSSEIRAPEEREIKFSSHGSSEAEIRVIEGICSMGTGDSVILYTDGIAKTWAEAKQSPEGELAKVLAERERGSTDHLQEALMKVVNASLKRAKRQRIEDDLTAVVIRVERSAAQAAEEGK